MHLLHSHSHKHCLLLHQVVLIQTTDPEPEREKLDETLSEREEAKEGEISLSASSSTMPSVTKLFLLPSLLLLLLQGQHGVHCLKSLEMNMGMEMEMDSEAHSRMLWEARSSSSSSNRRYISYDALRSDVVPCSRQGVAYYNCRIMTTANPYTRGCESITRCRDVDP